MRVAFLRAVAFVAVAGVIIDAANVRSFFWLALLVLCVIGDAVCTKGNQ